jgi:hypothetical protein
MRKTVFTGIIYIFLAFAFITASAPNAEAKKKPKHKSKPGAEKMFFLDLGLNVTYDDNVINYSDSDLELFNSDSLAGKFAIESKDDWIITPRIHPKLKTKFIGGREATLELGFDYYAYMQNDVRRYSRFSLSGRQYFSKKGYGQLSYSYIPEYYYRNILYRANAQDSAQYIEANFSKHALAAEIGYELIPGLTGSATYLYQHKSFNKEFEYRNSNLNGIDLQANYRLKLPFRVWAIYGFESSVAKGADMADTILDVSYDAWDITLGGRYYSSILPKYKPEVYGSVQYRNIKFQTDRIPIYYRRNVFHYGRKDNNYQIKFGTGWRMPYSIRMEAEYAYSKKDVSLPDIYPDTQIGVTETTAQLEKKLNYTSNSITIRFSRQF